MYRKPKVKKSNRPDKAAYTIYYPHSSNREEREWTEDYLQFVSIDPGVETFSLRVERRYDDGVIHTYAMDRVAIMDKPGESKEPGDPNETFNNLSNLLEKYLELFQASHIFLIEKQLPENYWPLRVSQHAMSWLLIKLKDNPLLPDIIELDSKLKGRMLGAPKNVNSKGLKQWAKEEAMRLLELREDDNCIELLEKYRAYDKSRKRVAKLDDLCDTIVQIEAFCKYEGLVLTPE